MLGSINTDLVTRLPYLPEPGVTMIGREFFRSPGGKGANQAVAAARAGDAPVLLIAALGDDDFGRASLMHLQNEPLLLDYVTIIEDCASGVAMILVDDAGENCIAVTPCANERLTAGHVDEVPENVFASARVFLASLEVPLATVRRGLERAKAAGLTTVLNPAPVSDRAGVLGLAGLVDVLTPNQHEVGELLERQFTGLMQSFAAAEDLRACGFANVIVTLGGEGSILATTEGSKHVKPFAVRAIDSTAAGDAFSGALAAALAESMPLPAAARFASAAGAIAARRKGAQPALPRKHEIEELLSMEGE